MKFFPGGFFPGGIIFRGVFTTLYHAAYVAGTTRSLNFKCFFPFFRYVQLSSGVLHIYNVNMSDSGNYRCKAFNIANQRNREISVNVSGELVQIFSVSAHS
jgi:hypothetical protein